MCVLEKFYHKLNKTTVRLLIKQEDNEEQQRPLQRREKEETRGEILKKTFHSSFSSFATTDVHER